MKKKESAGGISLRKIHIVLIICAALAGALLLYASHRTQLAYERLRAAMENYISRQQAAYMLSDGSDYLTEQVRCFVADGDPVHVSNFFEETNVTRTRDLAVEKLESSFSEADTAEAAYLKEALRLSNELIFQEYDAMRLTILSNGYDPADFPEELRTISAGFYGLTAEEQHKRAVELVFGDSYADMKKAIAYNVSRCVDTLVEEARQEQIDSANYLSGLIRLQRILTAAVVIIALIMMTVTLNMVIYPIEATVNSIRNDEKLTPCGSREMRFLIDTYNNMYDRNSQNQSRLSYEASHDPLTGLYNRSVFKSVLSDSHEGGIGLMIIDIDHFKEVNDTYGHDAGDKVLKRVSSELQSHFRSEDYICRIGGDEFAVIMAHAGSELKDLVHMKAVLTAEGLRKDKNEVLGVTLSIGAAFSDEVTDEEDSLYKCADKALYQTKEKGKDGITFFGDLEDKTI